MCGLRIMGSCKGLVCGLNERRREVVRGLVCGLKKKTRL